MQPPRTDRLRSLTRLVGINVAVTLVLFIVALAIIEAYLRLSIPSSSGDSIFESTRSTKRYKVMKPNAKVISWGSELRTNGLGFRDDDAEIPAKAADETRLIVLGDSFTVSAGVDYEDIYTSLVEDHLQNVAPETSVINLAVGGYNIIQHDLLLEEVGFELQPDAVVVAVFPFNDLSSADYRANEADAHGTPTPSVTPWYLELYVYRGVLSRIETKIRNLLAPSGEPTAPPAETNVAVDDARDNLQALEHLVDNATSRGLPVHVVLLPNTDDFESQRGNFASFVELCESRLWKCSNLIDRFVESGVSPRSLRLNLLDSHPNEKYNALVAQFIAADLEPLVAALNEPDEEPAAVGILGR